MWGNLTRMNMNKLFNRLTHTHPVHPFKKHLLNTQLYMILQKAASKAIQIPLLLKPPYELLAYPLIFMVLLINKEDLWCWQFDHSQMTKHVQALTS